MMFEFLLFLANSTIVNLQDLDQLFRVDDFDSAFHESDRAVVEFQSCVSKKCDKWKLGFVISNKTSNSAVISTYDSDGTELFHEFIFKKDWEKGRHNRVRIKMENFRDQGYRTEIRSITKFVRKILLNGRIHSVDTYIVEMVAAKSKQPPTRLSIEVANGVGGLGQMIKTSETSGSQLESYEVKELEFYESEKSVL